MPGPRRNPVTRFGRDAGFGGFRSNPSVGYPGGRALVSDVEQAAGALEFDTPLPMPTATPGPTATPTVTDPSGAGLAPSSLTGNTLASLPNEPFNSQAQPEPSPTEALPEPEDRLALGSAADMTGMSGDAWTAMPNRGGNDIAAFGGNMTIGQFLNTPLAMLRFGEGRGYQAGQAVGGGQINYAGTTVNVPGTAGSAELAPVSSEAERLGAAETAALKESGQLNPDGTTPGEAGATTAFGPTGTPQSPIFGNLANGTRVYSTGNGVWRPVSSAPVDIRWNPNSGTGNWTASRTTRDFLMAGGYFGQPNRNTPDVRDTFDPRFATGYVDENGFIVRRSRQGGG